MNAWSVFVRPAGFFIEPGLMLFAVFVLTAPGLGDVDVGR